MLLQKKYQQCPADKPGAMILDEMKDAEEYNKAIDELTMKEMSHKEFDEWMNKLIAKNGTTNY